VGKTRGPRLGEYWAYGGTYVNQKGGAAQPKSKRGGTGGQKRGGGPQSKKKNFRGAKASTIYGKNLEKKGKRPQDVGRGRNRES